MQISRESSISNENPFLRTGRLSLETVGSDGRLSSNGKRIQIKWDYER